MVFWLWEEIVLVEKREFPTDVLERQGWDLNGSRAIYFSRKYSRVVVLFIFVALIRVYVS